MTDPSGFDPDVDAPAELGGKRALVVDDDPLICALLRRALEGAGTHVTEVHDGDDAVPALTKSRYDVVLLDIDLPGLNGFDVLARVRRISDIPVLMVTASDDEATAVRALREGADDYVRKPIYAPEVIARAAAVVRRAPTTATQGRMYADAVLEIDFDRAEVRAGGDPIRLRPLEYQLLTTLVEHRGQALDPRQLLRLVWGESHEDAARVKVLVSNLRSTLVAAGLEDPPIETVRGVGYRYRRG
jgi:DNA-binding response OmpR family regulator